MSYDSKGFWIVKNNEHTTEEEQAYDNPTRGDTKRSHSWFVDSPQPDMFPNKKHVIEEDPTEKSNVGVPVPSWENSSVFHSVSNQFMERLLGPETPRSLIFAERERAEMASQPNTMAESYMQNTTSIQLSMSSGMEDSGNCFTGDGIRKLRVSRVKEGGSMHGSHSNNERKFESSSIQGCSHQQSQSGFVSMGDAYDKEGMNGTLGVGVHHHHPFGNEESNIMVFGEMNDEHGGVNGFHSYGQSTVHHTSELVYDGQQQQQQQQQQHTEALSQTNMAANEVVKSESEASVMKNKSDMKQSKKEVPTSFPSNVRSLISTGMLDGVPVKYISLSCKELQGVIKGSGYLCGCQDCNLTKVVNAYAFERHAGCKTKHPNNHIYFENGKTIYQIVQELRNTPESMLFDVIQTVFGSPLNQKAFRNWKESFQAATRELQRIYGKDDTTSCS